MCRKLFLIYLHFITLLLVFITNFCVERSCCLQIVRMIFGVGVLKFPIYKYVYWKNNFIFV